MSELRRARINAGYTINEAAEILKIHPSTISRYETGRVKQIPKPALTRLQELYNEKEQSVFQEASAYLKPLSADIAAEYDRLDERGQKLVSALIRMETEWADGE